MSKIFRNSSTIFTAVALSGVLSGCVHLRAREVTVCRGMDWWEAGRTDGVAGLEVGEAITEIQKRCALATPKIDFEAFLNGHEAGWIERSSSSASLDRGPAADHDRGVAADNDRGVAAKL